MEDYSNHTTPYVPPSPRSKEYYGYYVLIPIALVTLVALAMVIYFKRKYQSDELRYRLIPMYSYDPAEQDDDKDLNYGSVNEDMKELLHKYGRLSVDSDYGTVK